MRLRPGIHNLQAAEIAAMEFTAMKYIVFILFTVATNAAAPADAEARHDDARAAVVCRRQPDRPRSCRSSSARGYSRGSSPSSSRWRRTSTCCRRWSSPSPYPFLSLAYVAVLVFAYFVFPRGQSTPGGMAGVAFICVGHRADRTERQRPVARRPHRNPRFPSRPARSRK